MKTYKNINIHIKRQLLFATLTLTSPDGRTFVTTLDRGIEYNDPKVREMIRRFRIDEKVVDRTPVKQGVGASNIKQGVLV